MSEKRIILLLFLTAFCLRLLLYFIFANEVIPNSDQINEILLSRKFASGDLFGVLDTYWAPGYPVLIGLVSYFVNSVVIPAFVVSLIAGSITVPLTYLLVYQSYGKKVALIAASIAVFFPHLINSVFAIGSENLYTVFVLCSLIYFWKALTSKSRILFLTSGISAGLAYLTRPEAIGYLFYFIAFAGMFETRLKWSLLRRSIPLIAIFLIGFSLMATPYIVYLRSETGSWTVSGKYKINTILGGMNDPGESNGEDSTDQDKPALAFAKYFFINLGATQKSLSLLVPSLLFLFVGLGLFRYRWNRDRLVRETYLIMFCLVTVGGYAAAVVQLRYLYVLLPLLFGWIANGIVVYSDWLFGSMHKWISNRRTLRYIRMSTVPLTILFVYLYVFPLNFFMLSADQRWRVRGYEEREAGLWLKKNAPPSPLVFSASKRPVFYAEGTQVVPKSYELAEVLSDIESRHVQYVITSERSIKRNPFLTELDPILREDPKFEVVYDKTDRPGYQITIYRMK